MNRLLPPALCIVCVFSVGLTAVSCGKKAEKVPPPSTVLPAPPGVSVDEPDFIVEAGTYPLWFEFGPDGPAQISSPEEASLSPLAAWPFARHVRFLLRQDGEIWLVVNRDGFLRVRPAGRPGGAPAVSLTRYADPAVWGRYTAAAGFRYAAEGAPADQTPAALLYRDTFFADPTEPPPEPRAYEPDIRRRGLNGFSIPAFAAFPPAEGWDIDGLGQGEDGFWYYRAVKIESGAQTAIRYEKTKNLDTAGSPADMGAFQQAQAAAGEAGNPSEQESRQPLPTLPEGFAWTKAAVCGSVIIAAWEEQQGFNIGAAGIMLIAVVR